MSGTTFVHHVLLYPPSGEQVGVQNVWIAFAFINEGLSIPVLVLLYVGDRWWLEYGEPAKRSLVGGEHNKRLRPRDCCLQSQLTKTR